MYYIDYLGKYINIPGHYVSVWKIFNLFSNRSKYYVWYESHKNHKKTISKFSVKIWVKEAQIKSLHKTAKIWNVFQIFKKMYFEKVLETKKVPMAALKVSQKGHILVLIIKTLESDFAK